MLIGILTEKSTSSFAKTTRNASNDAAKLSSGKFQVDLKLRFSRANCQIQILKNCHLQVSSYGKEPVAEISGEFGYSLLAVYGRVRQSTHRKATLTGVRFQQIS